MGRRIVVAAVILAAAAALAATRVGFLQGSLDGTTAAAGTQAPEFAGISGWLNSDPLTLRRLRGKVVLIDFWAYSCVNCVRTFPHLRALYARYHPFGLEIVGVHSPEFRFEAEALNVAAAARRHRLAYPIALDSQMETWRAYRNNYWPRVYLLDAQGRIRFDHIGEGGEEQIQSTIRTLLTEAGARLPRPIDLRASGPNANITPEIYAGAERGSRQGGLANDEGYRLGAIVDYRPVPAGRIRAAGTNGAFFLEGRWRSENEYVEAASASARVILPFRASDVFMVAAPAGAPTRVRLALDGRPIDPLTAGRSDLFPLVEREEVAANVLTLEVSPGFRLYTFTFG